MKTVFDLPAHPLFVHFPVVLIPLTATVATALAVRPTWRRRHGPVLTVAVFVATASTFLTARSGYALNDALKGRIGDLAEKHQDLGERTVVLSIAFLVGMLLVVVFDRVVTGRDALAARVASNEAITRGLMGITAIAGLLATIWMIRTGHEGATIVWEGVLPDEG